MKTKMKTLKKIVGVVSLVLAFHAGASEDASTDQVKIKYVEAEMTAACPTLQVCDIEMEPGEQIEGHMMSDKTRWTLNIESSDEGPQKVQHIILMPIADNLKTKLQVLTNRRKYHLNVESDNSLSMRNISFIHAVNSDKIAVISKLPKGVVESEEELQIPGQAPSNADRTVKTVVADSPALVPVTKAMQTWQLTVGRTIGKELHTWSQSAGWQVIWNLPKDWSVPSTTTFTGDFKTAASEVISTLAKNGALVRAQFYDGNKTMVVTGPGVTPQ